MYMVLIVTDLFFRKTLFSLITCSRLLSRENTARDAAAEEEGISVQGAGEEMTEDLPTDAVRAPL